MSQCQNPKRVPKVPVPVGLSKMFVNSEVNFQAISLELFLEFQKRGYQITESFVVSFRSTKYLTFSVGAFNKRARLLQ